MSEQQNTQQPVAWIEACDLDEAVTSGSAAAVIHGTQPDYEYVPLYTAPPIPRDVLMAFGEAVLVKAGVFMYESDIAALADRYASRVQPEPVNQQLLAALEPFAKAHETWNGGNAPLHFSTAAVPAHFRRAAYVYRAAIAAAEAAQPVGAEVEQLKVAANNWPAQCPITRRDFFMEIDGVPTYGGPYDSYTIPEMTGEATQPFHERELFVRRYDHDLGGWVDDEFIPLRVIHEDVLMELEEAAQQPASAQPVAVPDGYVLVPKEPTTEMQRAGCAVPLNKAARHNAVYRAMLAAYEGGQHG